MRRRKKEEKKPFKPYWLIWSNQIDHLIWCRRNSNKLSGWWARLMLIKNTVRMSVLGTDISLMFLYFRVDRWEQLPLPPGLPVYSGVDESTSNVYETIDSQRECCFFSFCDLFVHLIFDSANSVTRRNRLSLHNRCVKLISSCLLSAETWRRNHQRRKEVPLGISKLVRWCD